MNRSRTDMPLDQAAQPLSGSAESTPWGKLDETVWQGSVAALRRAFIFDSSGLPSFPPELISHAAGPAAVSGDASDHLPVVVDLVLPFVLSCNTGAVDLGSSTLGGTVLPVSPTLLGPIPTDAAGALGAWLPDLPAPVDIHLQWAVPDPGASFSIVFSNALVLQF